MAKQKLPAGRGAKRFLWAGASDLGETDGEKTLPVGGTGGAKGRRGRDVEKVEPAFVPERRSWWSDLPLLARATAIIVATILGIAGPSIWYVSRIDANVDHLKLGVADIKARADELFRATVQQQGRIDLLEKSVDAIKVEAKTESVIKVSKKLPPSNERDVDAITVVR